MTFRGTWIPRDDTEEEFLTTILAVSREAYANGIPPTRIAGLCGFASLSILDTAVTPPTDSEAENQPVEAETEAIADQPCPACGEAIVEVTLLFGGCARVDHADGTYCEDIDIESHPFLKEIWDNDRHTV